MWNRASLPSISALCVLAGAALAANWYPISQGSHWEYTSALGVASSGFLDAAESFGGELRSPLRWSAGTREYFSRDDSGNVYQHGVRSPDGSVLIFFPALLRMEAELNAGQEWETVGQAVRYNAIGVEISREDFRSSHVVLGTGQITVGAGSFEAMEILRIEEMGPSTLAVLAESSLAGAFPRVSQSDKRRAVVTFRDHYVDGVGWVLRKDELGFATQFELQSYEVQGVATARSSWGAIKSQFRP